jgi:transposase
VDRRKPGSKHNLITDANGLPLAAVLCGANGYDSKVLPMLVEAIAPVRGRVGHPRRRPDIVQGDAGYRGRPNADWLRARGIRPLIPLHRGAHGSRHGSGLGVTRWVVERTISWLHQFRRLRVRYERRADIHQAFMILGCAIICWRHLEKPLC